MSNLKKILALALVFAIAFTMAAGAAYPAGGYLDKDDISAATLDSIIYLADLGIMSGAPASTENEETGAVTQGFKFMPTETLTRAQFCRMIYSIETGRDNADLYKTAVKTGFTDVPSGEWYAGFVNYAWLMGWVSGKSATRFDPNGQLKLSEAVTLVLAYLGYDKADLAKAWPSNALLYGSIKGLFGNGVETSGAVGAPIARQWAAVLITNTLDSTFVTKNDAGRYVDVSATTVKEARLGSFKTVEGIIVANNRFGILDQDKTDNANKFKVFIDANNNGVVDTGEKVINFSKQFAPIDGIMFTETQDVSNAINLGDAFLGAKVKILYRETAKGNVIITYTVDAKVKTGAVAKADIKFDSNKVTLGSVAAQKEYTGTDLNKVVFLINGKKYSGTALGIGTGANLKTFVDKFPANTTFTFTVLDGVLKTAIVTYQTFGKVEAITVAEYPKQTPNEFGANVTEIKIGGTTYKRADGKIVNTASTDQGNAANKANLIAKDDYALFWVDAVTGNITVNKVAKAEAKADYVVDGAADKRIISVGGKAYTQDKIVADGDVNIAVAGDAVNVKFNLISANGKALYAASVDSTAFAAYAGTDFFTYINGDVLYLLEKKTATTSSAYFYATKDVEIRYLGKTNNVDKYSYVITGFEAGAAKSYTVENVSEIPTVAAIAKNTLYKLAFTDGKLSGAAVQSKGVVGVAADPTPANQYVYNSTTKTLTNVGDGKVYYLSGSKIYGYKGSDASDGKEFKLNANISFAATSITASVYFVDEIYVDQNPSLVTLTRTNSEVTRDGGNTGGPLDFSFVGSTKTLTIDAGGATLPYYAAAGGANWVGVAINIPAGVDTTKVKATMNGRDCTDLYFAAGQYHEYIPVKASELTGTSPNKSATYTWVIKWGYGYADETITVNIIKVGGLATAP